MLKPSEKTLMRISLWTAAFLFLSFYLMLAVNNRLVLGDDVKFLYNLRTQGFIGSIANFEYNRRIAGQLLFNLIFVWNPNLEGSQVQIFLFHLSTLTGFILAIRYFLRVLTLRVLKFRIDFETGVLLSILITCGLFFFTFRMSEVWFWTCASVIHLTPLIFMFLGFSAILEEDSPRSSLIFISFLIIGGSSEIYVLLSFTLLSSLFLILNRGKGLSKSNRTKLFIAFVSMLILFILNLIGVEGVANRIALESNSGLKYVHDVPGFLTSFLEPKNILFLGIVALSFLLGNGLKSTSLVLNRQLKIKVALLGLGLLLTSALCTFAPLIYVFNSLGPRRAWMPFGSIFVLTSLLFSFLAGHSVRLAFPKFLTTISSILISTVLLFYIHRQSKYVFPYSKAYDDRISSLIYMQNQALPQENIIPVAPLPLSGMLIRSQLTPDPYGWTNELLARELNLDFRIYERRVNEEAPYQDTGEE